MKKLLLVIFSLSLFLTYIIYNNCCNDQKNILLFGNIKELNNIKNNNYKIDTFLYDNITYKEMINAIRNNDYIMIKKKKININQAIYNCDYLIISATKQKNDIIYLKELINKIKRIKNIKIFIVEESSEKKLLRLENVQITNIRDINIWLTK